MQFCKNCGTQYEPGKKFCRNCGQGLDEIDENILKPKSQISTAKTGDKSKIILGIILICCGLICFFLDLVK